MNFSVCGRGDISAQKRSKKEESALSRPGQLQHVNISSDLTIDLKHICLQYIARMELCGFFIAAKHIQIVVMWRSPEKTCFYVRL